ncbi:alginate lyase family protein [Paenibacillus sp. FA6]|uniref:alginate lyase family protein n=1 Tax=Paenibacillus sp. FA6 TaxID=3413029 RepID=UPI003F65989A
MAKVKRLRNLPLDQAVKKIAITAVQQIRYTVRKYKMITFPIQINTAQFNGFQSDSRYFFHVQDRTSYVEQLIASQLDISIIKDADRICSHQFDLLGSGPVQLGAKFPWNEDFKTKYRWRNTFYKQIPIVDLGNAADVKIPWELSRFQHLFTMGKAYWITDNEKYALEFQAQIDDWIDHNPIEMSVNWTCTMDVAIRAVNWISGCYFFQESPSISSSFWERIHTSLYLHGQFIMNNLENTGEHTGNHYLSNLVGLISLGIYFGEFKASLRGNTTNHPKRWLEYAYAEMEREMFVQVNNDGTNYEASTSYHRLVAECFLLTTVVCSHNHMTFTKEYMQRLERMFEYMMHMTKPNGRFPIIGDADDGRLLIVSRYGNWIRNDGRHLLTIAGELFDRDDFRFYAQGEEENSLWITGSMKTEVAPPVEKLQSISFQDGGYFILRNSRTFCHIRCGEMSFHGHGAHSHNDQLSFELQLDGHDFIIDPGSYVYTADYRMRNHFRSTMMHNTIRIGDKEQNDFDDDNLFLMREQTFAQCDVFTDSRFAGHHQGYKDKLGIVHHREFTLRENHLEISDVLEDVQNLNEQRLTYTAAYILSPGVEIIQYENHVEFHQQGLVVELLIKGSSNIEVQDCWVSSRYGVREPSHMIHVSGSAAWMNTIIQWSRMG